MLGNEFEKTDSLVHGERVGAPLWWARAAVGGLAFMARLARRHPVSAN